VSNNLKKDIFIFWLFATITFLNSCSLWSNFTVYYNRFYLAEKAFDDAEEEIKLNPKKNLFQFKEDKLPATANKNFDDVIKYSSKILQFNNNTKYVNKAIYMIAKSYYYKEMYNKAVRNFYELDKMKDEDLGLSTKLWIAKSEMQMRNFTKALELIAEVKITAKVLEEDDILFQAYITEISYLIYREEFSKAINLIEEFTQLDLDDDVKSTITYELGLLYVTMGNYEKAVIAFELVNEGSPTFEIEVKSKLEYAKAIKKLGRNDEAMQLLTDLVDDTKYEPYWDVINLEIAQIELESGKPDIALEIFYSIDTGYTKNESRGIAAFMQGDILEHIYMDYDSAKFMYDKVALKKAPTEYKKEALTKSNLLKTRKAFIDEVFSAKRGYNYLIDTTLFKSDSIAYAGYLARRDSAMQVENEKDNLESNTKTQSRNRRPVRGTQTALKAQYKYFEDSLFTYEPKLPQISVDSIRNQIAKSKYDLGNLYFSDLLVPDSAFYYYQHIINNYSDTKYFAKTIYALGSYYLTKDKNEKADSLFKFVYDNYSSDPIAKIAAFRLGIDTKGLNTDEVLEKYQFAEILLEEKKYNAAIQKLDSIHIQFPESQYSPKALYSIGWIYENKLLNFDRAVEYYDSLRAKYPQTDYVREVNPKLVFYHNEKKAVQDSIARAEKAVQDSIIKFENANKKSVKTEIPSEVNENISKINLLENQTTSIDSNSLISKDSTGLLNKLDSSKTNIESPKSLNLFEQAKEIENKGKK